MSRIINIAKRIDIAYAAALALVAVYAIAFAGNAAALIAA